VRWGADPDWPPFSTLDREGKVVGIDADITRLVAERVGLRIVFVRASSWAQVFEQAKAGEVDFLSATARSPERLESFLYSHGYGSFPVVIITRENSPFLTAELSLHSMTMAEARDHVTTTQLQQDLPTAKFILTDTTEEALQLVARGKADGTVQNLAVATRIVRLGGLTNLKISGVTHYEFPLRFAVRKDAPELVSILNKGLATLTPHETEAIYAAHLVPDIAKARDWAAWRRRALYAIFIGATVVGALLLWNFGLARQIRLRKAAESALREARDCVQQHANNLAARVKEVERLNHDLLVANQDLEAFSSSASHDLRAPLRRVNMLAGLVCAETENRLTPESRQWLEKITEETKRMDQLIRDLLLFARLGRTELHKHSLDMKQLVNDAIQEFRPQFRDRDVVWSVGDLGRIYGDPGLLHLAVANLIDNALKYTRRCSQARIKIDVVAEDRDHERAFYIQDNGCGFDPEHAGALFTPFYRLHHAKDYEGTGIGLANVKKIIERHGGRIWFESEPDKGATFYFCVAAEPFSSSSTETERVARVSQP